MTSRPVRIRGIVISIDVLVLLVIAVVIISRSWDLRIASVLIIGVLFLGQSPFLLLGCVDSIKRRSPKWAFLYMLHFFASWLLWLFVDNNDFLRLLPGPLN